LERARRPAEVELLRHGSVEREDELRLNPTLRGRLRLVRRRDRQGCAREGRADFCAHGLMIQLLTSARNRAAIALRPSWNCTATTAASAWRERSEVSICTWSSNSSGREEANSTSRAVPNSITVFSCSRAAWPRNAVMRTGMRTAVAWGNRAANPAATVCRLFGGVATASFCGTASFILTPAHRAGNESRWRASLCRRTLIRALWHTCTGSELANKGKANPRPNCARIGPPATCSV